MKHNFPILFSLLLSILLITSKLDAHSHPTFVNTIDQGDTIFIDVENAIVGDGYIDYPVYISSDDPIQLMDFQFFFNTGEFVYDTVINVAALQAITANVAPDVNQGGILKFRLTTLDFATIYPNLSTLFLIRFTTASLLPCNLNIVTNQNTRFELGTIDIQGTPTFQVTDCGLITETTFDLNKPAKIYPNPSGEFIYIDSRELLEVTLFSAVGQLIGEPVNVPANRTVSISTKEIQSKYFFIQAFSPTTKKMSMQKVFK
jgi:hypothetical protein